ncbi:hypothetical protein B9Z19DRAFT_1129980 [Tuber borchii]|uniref:Uncharacterized protein n=1 Tax=Tuber borchii TaxID=42251 RepID=A0A2T6ZLA1_TUBBO|nr:hypothetical protein B9Z19DRAFT_1129980 [Tuber borchii]
MEAGGNQGGGTGVPVKSSCPKRKGVAASLEMVMLGERIGEMERRMMKKFTFPVGGLEECGGPLQADMGLLGKKPVEVAGKKAMGIISATQKPSPFYTFLAVLVTPIFLLALAAYVITTVETWSRYPKLSRSYVGGVGRRSAGAGPAQWADMSVLEKVEGVLRWEGWWGGRK